MEKKEFVEKCMASLQESVKVAESKFQGLVTQGAIDLENADMIDVKAAVAAFLKDEVDQFTPLGTSHLKRFKRSVRNNGYLM